MDGNQGGFLNALERKCCCPVIEQPTTHRGKLVAEKPRSIVAVPAGRLQRRHAEVGLDVGEVGLDVSNGKSEIGDGQ